MNQKNLQVIFKKYIDHFERINSVENDENYKWEIAQKFQEFDVDAPDFADMLLRMLKISENLIDSSQQLPFYALVDYARKEPETVREMFRALFADEHLDVEAKQATIVAFIEASEELRKKYSPDSRLYMNNQRSVMMYLFLKYPNSNYGYKASQAKSFADCIEFYDDWGPMNDFNLGISCRMCDQLVEEIKKCDALVATHKSRYENTDRNFHADENLHILALDIIYSSQVYNFYDGMTFAPINAQARKLHFERVKKANELKEALEKAQAADALLTEAREYFIKAFETIKTVKHKAFGEGTVESFDGSILAVYFPKVDATKKLGLTMSLQNKLIICEAEGFTEAVEKYSDVMKYEHQIPSNLKRAEEEIQPYLEYLE